MIRPALLPFLPLFVALAWAAVQDVRTRRIRNVLTLALALAGVVQSFAAVGTVGPVASALGLTTGFTIGCAMLMLGGMCGGDVKLLAAVGAWLGPWGTVATVVGAAIFGIVFAIYGAARDGQLNRLFQSTAAMATNAISVSQLGVARAVEASREHVSVGRPLPYAVPVMAAAVVVVLLRVGV